MGGRVLKYGVFVLLFSVIISSTVKVQQSNVCYAMEAVSDGDCAPSYNGEFRTEEAETVASRYVEAPKFTVKGVFGGRTVTFASATQGATIYYKKGSSNITLSDNRVENGGTVLFNDFYGTIYAKAYKDGIWSDAGKFVLKIPVVNAPVITVKGEKVTIQSATPNSYICYTTDGTKPSWENGKRIPDSGGTISVSAGQTVRAIAVRSCFSNSKEAKAYIPIQPVSFKVKGMIGGRNVAMTSATEGVEIYYSTKTGSITTADRKLQNGESVDFSNFYGTVYARAYKDGKWSNVARLVLKIPQVNKPTITQNGTKVTIETSTPACSIYYTKDGSTPSPNHGTKVNGSRAVITARSGETVKAIAVRSCFSNSQTTGRDIYIYERETVAESGGGKLYATGYGYSTARWSHVMNSYIYENQDGTFTVVDGDSDNNVRVDTYNRCYDLISSKSITAELPVFGGFYSGENYNFLVFGQDNLKENDKVVTFKVVKYSKDWKKLGVANYAQNNTYQPFAFGSLRMKEQNGYLYVRTCHTMYMSGDGLHHQANVTFSVNVQNMEVVDSYSGIANISVGYVSHSFNQFVQVDDGYLVAVDHGDAYPRSVVLTKYLSSLENGKFLTEDNWYSCENVDLFTIPGIEGANCTGVTVGGFETSGDNYLVAINTIDHSKVTEYTSFTMTGLDRDERNVVLLVSAKDNLDSAKVKQIYLTDYVGKNKLGSTPYLVKLSKDKFLVIWEEFSYHQIYGYYSTISNGIKYVTVDGAGNLLTKIQSMPGELSYTCQPVYLRNEVMWYVNETENGVARRRFYKINVGWQY